MAQIQHNTPWQIAGSTKRKGDSVAVFLVERRLPGMSLEHLAAAHRALAASAHRLSSGGDRVRYLRSTFVPARARCLCVFEATSGELVRRVNEVAQVPFVSIQEAIEFPDPGSAMP
jgi:Nickel responsive protein SCO4226-like